MYISFLRYHRAPFTLTVIGCGYRCRVTSSFLEQSLPLSTIFRNNSKARSHFAEAVALVPSLNRVLILPRVGESRIVMNGALPYCAYFDVAKLTEKVRWLSFGWYLRTSLRLHKKPTVHFLCVSEGKNDCTRPGKGGRAMIPLFVITHGVLSHLNNTFNTCLKDVEGCSEIEYGLSGHNHINAYHSLNVADLLVMNKGSVTSITPTSLKSSGPLPIPHD